MSKKNIAVLVSGGGTNLQSLIDCEKQGMFGESKITLVVASNRVSMHLKEPQTITLHQQFSAEKTMKA